MYTVDHIISRIQYHWIEKSTFLFDIIWEQRLHSAEPLCDNEVQYSFMMSKYRLWICHCNCKPYATFKVYIRLGIFQVLKKLCTLCILERVHEVLFFCDTSFVFVYSDFRWLTILKFLDSLFGSFKKKILVWFLWILSFRLRS